MTTTRRRPLRMLLIVTTVLAALGACRQADPVTVRYVIESSRGSAVSIRVFIEGAQGQAVDGAMVVATNPAGAAQVLGYSSEEGCYRGELGTVVAGDYTVVIRSRLLGAPQVERISHVPLVEEPEITALADDLGLDALLGENPHAGRSVSISWSPVSGATAYAVGVVEGTTRLWSASTAETSAILPADELDAGTYGFVVTAQCIEGDPLFESDIYYSASESAGATRYATLE